MIKPHTLCSLALLLALLSGCMLSTSSPVVWQEEGVDLVWPEPPETPRIRYLRSFYGPDDFKSKSQSSGVMVWLLGDQQAEFPLLSPFAVAASRDGSLWVADNGARMLYRFNLHRKKVEYFQEFAGDRLVSPSGVVVDDERQRIYLSDAGLNRIIILDAEGDYLDSWGPEGGFERPAGIALDSGGRLLVADALGGSVYIFNPDGTIAKKLGSKVNPDGRFVRPVSVAVGPGDEYLVLDALSFRIEVQDTQGGLLGTIGELGDAAGALARPKGLAVDREGHVFVSDSAFDNVQVFDMAGNLLMFLGETGGQPGHFNLPAGLFVDHEKRLLVADSYNHRVQAFQLLP